jgi:hypothetical protein
VWEGGEKELTNLLNAVEGDVAAEYIHKVVCVCSPAAEEEWNVRFGHFEGLLDTGNDAVGRAASGLGFRREGGALNCDFRTLWGWSLGCGQGRDNGLAVG